MQVQTDAIFDWTTADEIEFMRSFFERCRLTGNYNPFRTYSKNISKRRWDSTVDTDLVTLEANELLKKAGRLEAIATGN